MTRCPILPTLAVLALGPALLAQQFVYNAAALPAQALWTDGVAIADLDSDGDNDILFANAAGGYGAGVGAQQHLFLNNGAGVFAAAHANLGVGVVATRQVIVEDIDNDGDPDILYARDSGWPGPTAPPIILINNGVGVFSDQSAARIPAGFFMTGFGISAGDVDNDGDLDVVVTNGGTFAGVATQARILMNNGTGFFTDGTAARLPVDLYNGNDTTLLDVDNDFDIDIVLNGKGSAALRSRLYLNDGAGFFTISPSLNAVGTSGTYEVDYGDFDGDNDFDAVVQSISGGSLEGWAQNVGTVAAWPKVTFTNSVNQDDNEMGCIDYDNDGDLDCLIGSLSASERMYTNNSAVFSLTNGVIQVVGDSTLDYALGDLNGDNKYDLVTGQGESGSFTDKVYMNNGPADTLPPSFENVETPAAIGATATIFRVRVGDALSEDGHVNVTVTYAWTTDLGSGSGDGVPQGLGQFRAAVPTTGATSCELTWTATDSAGNVANFGPIIVTPSNPWSDLGRALTGVSGDPQLVGTGPLTTGSAGALTLTNAAPSAPCILFVSLSSTPVPFKGGQLCAFPTATMLTLSTDGSGGLALAWPSWPGGLSGQSLFFQYGISDGAAIHNVSLSNCVQGDVP